MSGAEDDEPEETVDRIEGTDGTVFQHQRGEETTTMVVDDSSVVVQGSNPELAVERAGDEYDHEAFNEEKGFLGRTVDRIRDALSDGEKADDDDRTWTLVTSLSQYDDTLSAGDVLGERFDEVAFGNTATGELGGVTGEVDALEAAGFDVPETLRAETDDAERDASDPEREEGNVRLIEEGDELGETVTAVLPKGTTKTGGAAIHFDIGGTAGIHQDVENSAETYWADENRRELGLREPETAPAVSNGHGVAVEEARADVGAGPEPTVDPEAESVRDIESPDVSNDGNVESGQEM